MSIQKITDDNLASYALGIKLRDIAAEATKGTSYQPKPTQSNLTKEIIQEYQDEQNKPFIYEGRLYKYHPSTINIELKQVNDADLLPVLTEDQLIYVRDN